MRAAGMGAPGTASPDSGDTPPTTPGSGRADLAAAVTLRAGCKVNLYLRITGVRPDGYHELDTLFLPLPEPCDLLHVTPRSGQGIAFSCTEPDVDPARNTVTAAYEDFATATGFRPGLAVHLEKGIPHGAGLGGGSADAAALLRHLAALCAEQAPGKAPAPETLRRQGWGPTCRSFSWTARRGPPASATRSPRFGPADSQPWALRACTWCWPVRPYAFPRPGPTGPGTPPTLPYPATTWKPDRARNHCALA